MHLSPGYEGWLSSRPITAILKGLNPIESPPALAEFCSYQALLTTLYPLWEWTYPISGSDSPHITCLGDFLEEDSPGRGRISWSYMTSNEHWVLIPSNPYPSAFPKHGSEGTTAKGHMEKHSNGKHTEENWFLLPAPFPHLSFHLWIQFYC